MEKKKEDGFQGVETGRNTSFTDLKKDCRSLEIEKKKKEEERDRRIYLAAA